eukprot:15343869-Ditylum_brightwellii.AAC.1
MANKDAPPDTAPSLEPSNKGDKKRNDFQPRGRRPFQRNISKVPMCEGRTEELNGHIYNS